MSNSIDCLAGSPAESSWKLTDVQLKCDVIDVDSAIGNEINAHLNSGKHIPLFMTSFYSQIQSYGANVPVANQKVTLNINRSLTRIKTMFITFHIDSLTYTGNTYKK